MLTFYQRYMTVCQMKTLTVQNTLLHCSVRLKTYQVISMGYKHMYDTFETMPKMTKLYQAYLHYISW